MSDLNYAVVALSLGFFIAGGPELIIRAVSLSLFRWKENRFWLAYLPSSPTIKFSGFDPSNKES